MTDWSPEAERAASRESARQTASEDSRGDPGHGRDRRWPTDTDVVGARGVAYLIDLVVTGVVGAALGLLAGGGTAAIIITTVLGLAYFGVLAGLTGKTVGKAAMGITLVDDRGRPPGVVAGVARYLLLIVDGFPFYVFPLVGFLVANGSETHQRIGDRVARTYVVRDPEPAWLPGAVREMGVVGVVVVVLGLAAGGTLIAADLSTLYEIEVITASCEDFAAPDVRDDCVTKGYEQHSNALILLGLLAMVLAVVAGLRSRAAAFALIVVGAVVLAIAVVGDLPDVDETGQIGITFEEAKAVSGPGLVLEFAGAGLCVVAGLLGAVLPRRRRYS